MSDAVLDAGLPGLLGNGSGLPLTVERYRENRVAIVKQDNWASRVGITDLGPTSWTPRQRRA